MAKKRKKRKRESYLEQVIYAHENGEDASGGYVFRLIGGFILDFFQTVWMIIKWHILSRLLRRDILLRPNRLRIQATRHSRL